MRRSGLVVLGAAALLMTGGTAAWIGRERRSLPVAEPRASRPPRGVSPVLPPPDRGIAAYSAAVLAGSSTPGEEALRAQADALVEANADLAEQKARAEGITVAELHELTFLGLLATRLEQWDAVERRLGRALPPEVQADADELVFASSDELKATLRDQVARGEPEAARWDAIRRSESAFVDDYVALTGLDRSALDELLAEPYAPGGG